jgi:hypothetical protein
MNVAEPRVAEIEAEEYCCRAAESCDEVGRAFTSCGPLKLARLDERSLSYVLVVNIVNNRSIYVRHSRVDRLASTPI